MLILDHGDSFFTVAGHLDALEVALGQRVAAGDRVGTAGETGSLSGPRLYFEIRRPSRRPRLLVPGRRANARRTVPGPG
jgi:septal ring factor EnvC (AmiA/AmiB activator)